MQLVAKTIGVYTD